MKLFWDFLVLVDVNCSTVYSCLKEPVHDCGKGAVKGPRMEKNKINIYTYKSDASKDRVQKSGARMMVYRSKKLLATEGNKVVSPPNQPLKWKDAAALVVEAHAGAWKRLED